MISRQKSEQYAKSVIDGFGVHGVPCGIKDIQQMIADAHYAGVQDAASSQWQRSEDELPQNGLYLIIIRYKDTETLEIGRWVDGKYQGSSAPLINLGAAEVIAWMEVPKTTCL